MDLAFEQALQDRWTVLAVRGEVDVYSAPQLRDRLQAISDAGARLLLLDLNQVDFMDSTGLGVVVGAHKRLLSEGGLLEVVCRQPTILKVLEITGLDHVITVHESVDAVGSAPS